MSKLNLIGEVFGRLTVISEHGRDARGQIQWLCGCSCGNNCIKTSVSLSSRGTKSCGCFTRTAVAESNKRRAKHNLSGTKAYGAWADAKQRCYNPNHSEYVRYGAKGITMSDEFLDDPQKWCDYLGQTPDSTGTWSVDRIDSSKGYERGNLRWATPPQQTRNQGQQSNNTSGYTGVTLVYRKGILAAYMAQWKPLNGKTKSAVYSISKYGDELARFLAEERRDLEIRKLNLLGADYSPNHGKPKQIKETQ